MKRNFGNLIRIAVFSAATLGLCIPIFGSATEASSNAVKIFAPKDMPWQTAPAYLHPGAKIAVLFGDPMQAGLFIFRLNLPANYQLLPHTHPVDEYVTVIKGTFNVALGSTLDKTKGVSLSPGTFFIIAANQPHFAWAGADGAIVQIQGIGPSDFDYINSKDDPRNK